MWSCPHCAFEGEPATSPSGRVLHCPSCRFVFPSSSARTQSAITPEPSPDISHLQEFSGVPADRYAIEGEIAQGSQGKLVRARHRHLDLPCVIKTAVVDDEAWSQVAGSRLRAEARAGGMVNHQHVARVLDCDAVGGRWYFVMEYIEGLNLRSVLEEIKSLPWPQVIDIGYQVARGLDAIHRAQLIHRDIKPSNLMIDLDGSVKITDLGLVKMRYVNFASANTKVGQMLGTPLYMPPEQFDGQEEIDVRADIYALGATLYHLLVGDAPFRANGLLDLSMKHHRDPVVWPDPVRASTPPWVLSVIEACMAKRPEHRFQTAADLVKALQDGESVVYPQTPQPSPGNKAGAAVRWVVMQFRNVSGNPDDDWIGDALADFVTYRLSDAEGSAAVDRQTWERLLHQHKGEGLSELSRSQILDRAKLVGGQGLVLGSYQRIGSKVLITAQAFMAGWREPKSASSVEGELNELFQLEERIAQSVLHVIGRPRVDATDSHSDVKGTSNLEAHEALIRGQRCFMDGHYAEAIERAEHAISLDSRYIEPLSLAGACCARVGDYARAVEFHQRQERVARDMGDQRCLAEALGNLGVMYYYQGEYDQAYEFLHQARRLSDKLNRKSEAAKFGGNLGFVLMRLNRLDEAEKALEQAIAIQRELGDLVGLAWPYSGMGAVLLMQKRLVEAKEYYQRACVLAEEVGDRVTTGLSHMNLGRCAALLEDFSTARNEFERALSILQGTDFWNGLTMVHEYMAEMHLQLGETEEAIDHIDRRIKLAQRHHNRRMEAAGWEQKARAHELLHDNAAALRCLKTSLDVSQRPQPNESLHRYLDELARRRPFE